MPNLKNLSLDISKHVDKIPENFKKSKTRKNNCQNSENIIFAKNGPYVEEYTAGHPCTKFEGFVKNYEAMIAKKWVRPTFACKNRSK